MSGAHDDRDGIDYGSYLALDELLSLQRPRSRPEHPDELLFIVVHQASELWFKAILQELDQLTGVLERKDIGLSLWHMQRLNALMRIVSAQLDSLETLPPQRFAEFPSKSSLATRRGLPRPSLPCLSSNQSKTSGVKQLA